MAKKSAKSQSTASASEAVALNVLSDGGERPKIRKSRAGPWRAGVLITLNLLMIAHIIQWLIMGRTVSPIEPSEFRLTLERGELNAGFIFFSLALLATFILGRWVCGWGCHIVALQDLCGWAMRKLGVRPKPFRSRLLRLVPLIAALYMFVWPTAARLMWPASYAPFPGFSNHLMTEGFWDTFGPVYMAFPFLAICGFATVYTLGAKGFCTYACPYGGFFSLIDHVAPGRIRVTDACEQSGHCTVACTSNVRVNLEVRDYGMVVDPGCMKCLDCVTVCPNDALYFGFGRPSLFAAPRTPAPAKPVKRLSWSEDIAAAALFGLAMFALRGLYDSVPFLMALGCSAVFAFLVLRLNELVRKQNVSIQSVRLKVAGKLRAAGGLFGAITVLLILFVCHSALIQYHAVRGRSLFNLVQAPEELVLSGEVRSANMPPEIRAALDGSMRHMRFCEKWGLTGTYQTNLNLAWLSLVSGEREPAASYLLRAQGIDPKQPFPHYVLGRMSLAAQRTDEAARHFRDAIEKDPQFALGHHHLGGIHSAMGQTDQAIEHYRLAIESDEHRVDTRLLLGSTLAVAGQIDEAIIAWRETIAVHDDTIEAYHNLAGALRQQGRLEEAVEHYLRAADLAPSDAEIHFQLGVTYSRMNLHDKAAQRFDRAIELDPRYRVMRQQFERQPEPRP